MRLSEELGELVEKIWSSGKYKIRGPLLILGTSLILMVNGCGNGGSNINGGGNNGGGGNYGNSSGVTNSSGKTYLTVNSQDFDISVEDEDGNSLSNINVKGVYNGSGSYSFLMEDFSYNYFCEEMWHGPSLDNVSSTINLNAILSEINPYSGDFKIKHRDIPNGRDNPNLNYEGTVIVSDLLQFYQEHDAVFQNKSFMEFMASYGFVEFTVALKAQNFRETFIENINNVSDIINEFAEFFGSGYNNKAHYLDVFSNNLGVITHFESDSSFCTGEGYIKDEATSYGINGASITTTTGSSHDPWYSSSNGAFVLTYVRVGSHNFIFSKQGYQDEYDTFFFFEPPYLSYTSKDMGNILLTPQGSGLDTTLLTLQPGYSGEDITITIGIYSDGDTTYLETDGGSLYAQYTHVTQGNEWYNNLSRSLIKFDLSSVPSGANVIDAKLKLYGYSSTDFNSEPADVEVRNVISSWNEEDVTWPTQPNYLFVCDNGFNIPTYFNWSSWDVTDEVNGWIEGLPNFGLVVNLITENYFNQFYICCSSDNSDSSKRPKLEIKYIN